MTSLRSVLITCTLAPLTTAPVGSLTMPRMSPVISCAIAAAPRRQSTNPATQLLITLWDFLEVKACQADDVKCASTARLKDVRRFIIDLRLKKIEPIPL